MKAFLRENRALLGLLLLFGFVRTSVAGYNPIPSGSMHPNLLEGDVVLVNHVAYDFKVPLTHVALARLDEPQRGEVVVFDSPEDGKLLIKRLIAVPGDVVAMRDKHLVINGIAADYEPLDAGALRETVGGSTRQIQWMPMRRDDADNFGPIVIPDDQYLMLGDNRDNSHDSRFIGLVSRKLLAGRAERVLVSADITGNWLPRWDRFGKSLR